MSVFDFISRIVHDLRRPCLLPPIPFLNSPREKNQNGNGAAEAVGGNARYSARWAGFRALARDRGVLGRVKATTHAARAQSGVLLEVGSDFLIQ